MWLPFRLRRERRACLDLLCVCLRLSFLRVFVRRLRGEAREGFGRALGGGGGWDGGMDGCWHCCCFSSFYLTCTVIVSGGDVCGKSRLVGSFGKLRV